LQDGGIRFHRLFFKSIITIFKHKINFIKIISLD
jgi:hypothetical protein